jgi:exopolysaccharide biosynthesis polyprenyl glycosylphosphotransferase
VIASARLDVALMPESIAFGAPDHNNGAVRTDLDGADRREAHSRATSEPIRDLHAVNGRLPTGPRGKAPLYEDLVAGMDQRTRDLLRHRNRMRRSASRESLVRRFLEISDVSALAAAWSFTALLTDLAKPGRLPALLAVFVASLPIWLALGRGHGLYDADVKKVSSTTTDEAVRLFHLVIVGAIPLYLAARFAGLDPTFGTMALYGALALPSLAFARVCARAVMRRRLDYVQNAVIVGADRIGQLVASKLDHGCSGINVVGFVGAEPTALCPELAGARFLGDLESLPTIVRLLDVERVIVAFSSDSNAELLTLLRRLDDVPVQVDIVPRLFDALGPRAQLHQLCGLPLIGLPPLRLSRAAVVSKRLLDIAGSTLLVVALAPLLVSIALMVKLTSPGPVFYRGARIGRNGTRFKLFKFRTMRIECCRGPEYGGEDAEAAFRELMTDPAQRAQFERAHKLARDPRVTPAGDLLRRTSLDELPQLFNVLKGDLALVGPRPITADEYDDLLAPRPAEAGDRVPTGGYWTIRDLRPGVTGYWQINGRSSTTYEERVRLDTAYATSWSLKLDLEILARTGPALLDRRNAC